VDDYQRWMRPRSPKWGTVMMPSAVFRQLARPFSALIREDADAYNARIDS
jgi:hypothetical protein